MDFSTKFREKEIYSPVCAKKITYLYNGNLRQVVICYNNKKFETILNLPYLSILNE